MTENHRRREIPIKLRAAVRARAQDRCEDCGRPLARVKRIPIPPLLWEPVVYVDREYGCYRCHKPATVIVPAWVIDGGEHEGPASFELQGPPEDATQEGGAKHDLETAILSRFPSYFNDYSKTVDSWYTMNHCHHCGAKFGEYFVTEDLIGDIYELERGHPKLEPILGFRWREPSRFRERRIAWGNVHHLDENPSNNDPGNLRLLCVRCHAVRHGRTPKRDSGATARSRPHEQ